MNETDPAQPMRFQKRDGEILQAIFDYDGVLARRHLHRMFWPGATFRAMERRLSKLYHNDYLDWPSVEQRRTKPIPEPVVWLGWRGAHWVAGRSGVFVEEPTNQGEDQMRKLATRLRAQGVRWQREPRWSQLEHDLLVVYFRLGVELAAAKHPSLTLEEWLPEGVFLSNMDVVEYTLRDRDGERKKKKKGVRPDGYFVIVDELRRIKGAPARQRFLLELDMSTHPKSRFGREKVAPGVGYVRSPEYKARFGYNSGRWLVITTGGVRMKNLMRQTEQEAGDSANLFFFTTLDQIEKNNVLAGRIWWQVGDAQPVALFPR